MPQSTSKLVTALFVASCFSLSDEVWATTPESPETAVLAAAEEEPVLLAQQRKRRKKKRRKKMSGEAGAAGGGAGIHAAHEGVDAPYKYEVGLLSDFAIESTKTGEVEAGSGVYNLGARMLYIIAASFEVGGELNYAETTTKGEDSESVDSSYVLTLLGAYNFGNIDSDTTVFFVNFGFGFGSHTTSTTVGEVSSEAKASITRLTFGLGLHYFVDSNVALTTQFVYDADTISVDGVDDPTTASTIHIAKIGFTLFI